MSENIVLEAVAPLLGTSGTAVSPTNKAVDAADARMVASAAGGTTLNVVADSAIGVGKPALISGWDTPLGLPKVVAFSPVVHSERYDGHLYDETNLGTGQYTYQLINGGVFPGTFNTSALAVGNRAYYKSDLTLVADAASVDSVDLVYLGHVVTVGASGKVFLAPANVTTSRMVVNQILDGTVVTLSTTNETQLTGPTGAVFAAPIPKGLHTLETSGVLFVRGRYYVTAWANPAQTLTIRAYVSPTAAFSAATAKLIATHVTTGPAAGDFADFTIDLRATSQTAFSSKTIIHDKDGGASHLHRDANAQSGGSLDFAAQMYVIATAQASTGNAGHQVRTDFARMNIMNSH